MSLRATVGQVSRGAGALTTAAPGTRIVVINPNSTPAITDQIRAGSSDLAVPKGTRVEVVTSPDGPAAIESDEDSIGCVPALLATALAHPADAYVIACFSDPGIDTLRSASGVPVFGIAESAVLTALARGRRVGVISSVEASVGRHSRYFGRIGLDRRIVADIAVGRGVLDLSDEAAALDVEQVGDRLVSEHEADVIVLGCAGLSHLRTRLQRRWSVPVIDPCRAAVASALASLADRNEQ
ncbi:aspartate/glutamate racemase family protein [Nakamurella alba]|nr:aspartate/glutamate racemase family protein [Nakamurella alba]